MPKYIAGLALYLIAILGLFFYFSQKFSHPSRVIFAERFETQELNIELWSRFELGSFLEQTIEIVPAEKMRALRLSTIPENTAFPYRAFGLSSQKAHPFAKGMELRYEVGFGKNRGISPPSSVVFISPAQNDVPWEVGRWYQCTIRPYPQDHAFNLLELFVKEDGKEKLLQSSLLRARFFPQFYAIRWLLSEERIELEIDGKKHFVDFDRSADFEKVYLYFLAAPSEPNIESDIYYANISVSSL